MVEKIRIEKHRLLRHHNSEYNVVILVPNKILRLDDTQYVDTVDTSNKLAMMPLNQMLVSYDRIERTNYFGVNDQSNQPRRGTEYLESLKDDDSLLHVFIAKFAVLLTWSLRVEFGYILHMILEKLTRLSGWHGYFPLTT